MLRDQPLVIRAAQRVGLAVYVRVPSGLTPEEFGKMQKGVVTLRDNLIKAAQVEQE
jgi:MarR family transcriptional regulator, organic hydroperoxide resistance regulator